MNKKSRIISEFIEVSEFNLISKSKEIVAESISLHAKIKKIINSYKSYMDANSYHYSKFMIDIDKSCDEFSEILNSMDASKESQEILT